MSESYLEADLRHAREARWQRKEYSKFLKSLAKSVAPTAAPSLGSDTPSIVITTAATPAPTAKLTDADLHFKRLALAKGNPKIIRIAESDKSAEDKGLAIIEEDRTTIGYSSGDWAILLGVTDGRIRQCGWWQTLQKHKQLDD